VIADRIRQTRSFLGREGLGPFLVKSLAGSGAVRLAAMAGSFAVGVQLARLLGVEGYGYYGLALSIITIVGIPGELGISRVVTREVAAAATTNDEPRLFGALRWARGTVLRLSVVMAALAVGGAFLAGAINPSVPTLAILFGAPVIPLMALARLDGGALQGLRHVVRGQIPANLLKPVFLSAGLLAVSVAGLRIGVAGAMALNSITAALVAVVAYAWLQQRLPKPQSGEVIRTGRQWLASSVPMALTDGMRTLQSELTILLIGIIAAPAAVGLFRVASATAMVAAVAVPAVVHVALPVTARLHAERDRDRLQKAVTVFAVAQFIGVLLLSLPLLVAPEFLLGLVFGDSFVPAATPLRVLAVGQIANAIFGPNAPLLNMTHHERRVTRAMAIALVVNIVGVVVLANVWGMLGAAVAFVLALICWNVVAWIDAKRLLGIETSILGVLRIA
jgi:O-antigen/teichoic acid export membrane protein